MEEDEEGMMPPAKEKDILDSSKYVFVPEVVREPRMHYQRVPRLGSFMAVPLCYNSCLFDEALEQAVSDMIETSARIEAQRKEKTEYYEGYEDRKAAAQNNGDTFDEEERQWEEIDIQAFLTQEVKYVVMLDTLG